MRFIELPYGLEEYSLHVSSELGQTGEQDITYSQILPTKYSITIDNITESFYMGLTVRIRIIGNYKRRRKEH